jgi:Ca2+-binding RTX toxin-like protein
VALNKPEPLLTQQAFDLTLKGYYRTFDTIKYGTANSEALVGGSLNDALYGNGGADILHGNNGDDWVDGGAGGDILNGGDGFDVASYINSPDGVYFDRLYGGLAGDNNTDNNIGSDAKGDSLANIEQINGSVYADTMYGNNDANAFYGYDGAGSLWLLFQGGGSVWFNTIGNAALENVTTMTQFNNTCNVQYDNALV